MPNRFEFVQAFDIPRAMISNVRRLYPMGCLTMHHRQQRIQLWVLNYQDKERLDMLEALDENPLN